MPESADQIESSAQSETSAHAAAAAAETARSAAETAASAAHTAAAAAETARKVADRSPDDPAWGIPGGVDSPSPYGGVAPIDSSNEGGDTPGTL